MGRGKSLLPLAAAGLAALIIALVCAGWGGGGGDRGGGEEERPSTEEGGRADATSPGGEAKERSGSDATEHTNNTASRRTSSEEAAAAESQAGVSPDDGRASAGGTATDDEGLPREAADGGAPAELTESPSPAETVPDAPDEPEEYAAAALGGAAAESKPPSGEAEAGGEAETAEKEDKVRPRLTPDASSETVDHDDDTDLGFGDISTGAPTVKSATRLRPAAATPRSKGGGDDGPLADGADFTSLSSYWRQRDGRHGFVPPSSGPGGARRPTPGLALAGGFVPPSSPPVSKGCWRRRGEGSGGRRRGSCVERSSDGGLKAGTELP